MAQTILPGEDQGLFKDFGGSAISQSLGPIAKESLNGDSISNFTFAYTDVIGNIRSLAIPMEKEFSGNMVIFPSRMKHQVYPFYECDEDRVSIAGNFGVIYE